MTQLLPFAWIELEPVSQLVVVGCSRYEPSASQGGGRAPLLRHGILKLVLLCLVGTQSEWVSTCAADEPRPNILVVLTDDQGFGDVQSHGNPHIKTPVQDRLATEGARFDRFFVSPVCAPTRASLLTGRWHLRTGVHGVTRGYETMRSSELTLAEVLRSAGYATAAIGKWHNGAHLPEHPRGQGFDHFFGFCAGHFNNYFDSRLEDDGRDVPFEGFIIDRLTDRALQFMQEHRDQPWFCYVAFNTPHSPWQVPEDYWQRYVHQTELPDDKARCAYAMVENIDDNLGRLLNELTRLELEKNTIVVFLTDNGANSDRFNAEMRGRKGSRHEGGSRVPCFVRWPGVIPNQLRVKPIAAHVDLLPTLCDLANVTVPATIKLDGTSVAPLLIGGDQDWPKRTLFTHWGDDPRTHQPAADRGAVRTDQWRAVCDGGNWLLFDMQTDPSEQSNVAQRFPDVVADLTQQYRQWFDEVTRDGFEPIPIQVGRADSDEVILPGHEAHLHPQQGSGIRYSGPSGWANDWIAGWTDVNSYPTWPLLVTTPGEYQVVLHYASSIEQVGSRARVDVGGQSLDFEIPAAHPLAPLPSPDRVPRGEVFESRWAKMTVGNVKLVSGRTELALHGQSKAAAEFFSVKAVSLRKLPSGTEQVKPNIVLIMADDMGFSDLGCYGGEILTPNLDRLARQGMRFTNFYNNAKCEPTRASLLTGKYPHQVGAGARVAYRSPTFGEVLRTAGYRTLMTGKWHAAERPFNRGFDRHFGLTDGCCNFFNPGLRRLDEPEPSHKNFPRRWAIDGTSYRPYSPPNRDFYTTDAFTDYALDYLDEYRDDERPFLLYVAYTAPHYPMHAWPDDTAKYRGRYSAGWQVIRDARYRKLATLGLFPELPKLSTADERTPAWDELTSRERDDWEERMAVYAAMVDRMDQNIGRLLDKIDSLGESDNTLVLFLSDNGGESDNSDWSDVVGTRPGTVDSFRTVGQPWANVSNTPFRKYKAEDYEGGISTPLIARWPRKIPAGVVSHQVGHIIDILPTLVELADADYPQRWADKELPLPAGRSLLRAFADPSVNDPRTLCWQWQKAGAIRQDNWKLVRGRRSGAGIDGWELYDVAHDRTELNDVSAVNRDRVESMAARWQQWLRSPEIFVGAQ